MQSSITAWLKRPPAKPIENSDKGTESIDEESSAPKDASHPTSFVSLRKPIPKAVTIEPCSALHVDGFKRLNAVLLPIPYPAKFYEEIVADPVTADITRVAIWHDEPSVSAKQSQADARGKVVAAVRCRLLQNPKDAEKPVLYISTIGTLAPYREHGLASHLLAQVTKTAVTKFGVGSIKAHAWEANEEGLEWYKRRGFRIDRREEGYYRRLAPKSAALVVVKDILPSDLLAL